MVENISHMTGIQDHVTDSIYPYGNLSLDYYGYVTPDPSAIYMRYIVNQIDLYLIPLVVIVGLFGNVISTFVFLTTHLRKMSWSIYLAALAISDSGFLLCVFVSWCNNIGVHLYHKNMCCQLFVYLTYVGSFLSVWYVVAFTLERYLVIQYPLRRNELTTPKRARIVVITMAVIAMIIYNFAIWTSGIKPMYHYEEFCTILPEYYELVTVLSNVDTFLTFVIPFIMIVLLNCGIVYKLARYHAEQRDKLARYHSEQRKSNDNMKTLIRHPYGAAHRFSRSRSQGQVMVTLRLHHMSRSRSISGSSVMSYKTNHRAIQLHRLTYMLLVVSGVFLLLNFPIHAVRFYVFIMQFADPNFVPSHRFVSLQKFFQYVYYFNFSVNFFLYSLCGRTFRQALRLFIARTAHKIRNLRLPELNVSCTATKDEGNYNVAEQVSTEKTNDGSMAQEPQ